MKTLIPIILIITFTGCVHKTIDTFEKYCDHIYDRNETQAFTWKEEAIKSDVVNFYNQILLSSIAEINLGGVSTQDSTVQLLYEKELIGVTQNGDELHIRNNFLISDSSPVLLKYDVALEETFSGFTETFQYLIDNRFELRSEKPEVQGCLIRAIGAFYKKIVIHGNSEDGEFIIINEDF